jgi:hypothetical protein
LSVNAHACEAEAGLRLMGNQACQGLHDQAGGKSNNILATSSAHAHACKAEAAAPLGTRASDASSTSEACPEPPRCPMDMCVAPCPVELAHKTNCIASPLAGYCSACVHECLVPASGVDVVGSDCTCAHEAEPNASEPCGTGLGGWKHEGPSGTSANACCAQEVRNLDKPSLEVCACSAGLTATENSSLLMSLEGLDSRFLPERRLASGALGSLEPLRKRKLVACPQLPE